MPDALIDLRSDTVTKPSPAMREFIARAEVADDVWGEDPTINRLQELTAELLGKESALYVPSGTMSNQIAVKLHTQPGDELLCEATCHIYNYEAGGPAARTDDISVETQPPADRVDRGCCAGVGARYPADVRHRLHGSPDKLKRARCGALRGPSTWIRRLVPLDPASLPGIRSELLLP